MNIKKFLFFSLIILMISLVVAQGIAVLAGEHRKAISGALEVPYRIYLNNSEPVAGFQLEVAYPSYLTYKGIEFGVFNLTIVENNGTDGLLRIAVLAGEGIVLEENSLFDIVFDVKESALAGNYSVNFSDAVFADINATIISLEIINGSFEIVAPYNFTFLPPISTEENFTLQEGATLPLKFNVFLNGSFVSDYSVLIRIFNQSLGIDYIYNASEEGDDYVNIDLTEEHYLVNVHTGQLNMIEGRYEVAVSFDNFQESGIFFDLVNKSQGIGKGKKK